jgi:oligoribonuclease NrnB/cAMP/cGMP phosphodiesterase (DHH superfamily)
MIDNRDIIMVSLTRFPTELLETIVDVAKQLDILREAHTQQIAVMKDFFKNLSTLSNLEKARVEETVANLVIKQCEAKIAAIQRAATNSLLLEVFLKILDDEAERINVCLRTRGEL